MIQFRINSVMPMANAAVSIRATMTQLEPNVSTVTCAPDPFFAEAWFPAS